MKRERNESLEVRTQRARDAIRVAEVFPVKGGDFLPIKRGGWFKGTEQRALKRELRR